MKSAVIILASILFFSGLYAAYIRFIPAPAPAQSSVQNGPTTLPVSSGDPNNPMPGGLGSWGNMYDKDQTLYARFRSADYQRRPDGTYHLNHPEAEFYEPSGEVIHLVAVTGDIRVDQNAQRLEMSGMTPSMPREGTLQNVKIDIYPNKQAYDSHPEKPDVTMTMPNMHFDTDTYQMLSEEYTDPTTGQLVPADQVPVTVRGNVEFDGNGMVLYWNDITHELKSLTIAHGRRMLIKDLSDKPAKPTQTAAAPESPQPGVISTVTPSPVSPAGSQEAPAEQNASAQPQPSQKTVFQATFSNDVRVTQSGVDRIWADNMYVDFLMGSQPQSQTQTEHTTPVAHDNASPGATDTKPDVAPSPSGSSPPPAAPAKSDDMQMNGPVEVFWNGPMKIVPAPAPVPHLASGQRIVRFTGSPVRVHGDDVDATGDIVSYNSADETARLRGTPDRPLVIVRKRPDGQLAGRVVAQNLRFSQTTHLAVFTGLGDATFPDPSNPEMLLKASWEKNCVIQLAPGATPGAQQTIHSADLLGNAAIIQGSDLTSPRLNLQGDEIAIEFQPKPATAAKTDKDAPADIRSVVTTGNAHCVIRDAKSPDRMIDTDKLTVTTAHDPTGKLFPQYVTADGNVHAQEGEQNLHSDRMDVTLAPATRPSKKTAADSQQADVELVRLLASGNVVAHGKNGSSAVGDLLHIEQRDGREMVTVLGQPPALINDGGGSLRGAEIDARPKDDWAMVPCPGSIEAAEASAKSDVVQPIDISWQESAEVRGADNKADIRGNVLATTTDEHGNVDTAKADRALLTLGPKLPTTRQSSTTRPDSDNPSLDNTQVHFLNGKEVIQVTLLDHAEVNSVLRAADGTLMRRMHIFGERIDYFTHEKKLVVPVQGRMLIQDNTPAPPKGDEANAQSPAGARGATAFAWTQNFTFDETAQQATFDSPVTIIHQSNDPHADPVRLVADHVVADFEPADAASAPADSANSAAAPLKLKTVTATGHVRIQSKDTEIDCNQAIDDPLGELLVAKGQPGNPVVVTKGDDKPDTFGEVWFNTRTGQIEKMTDFSGRSRG